MKNKKSKLIKLAAAFGLVAAIAVPAQAISITGDITFSGELNLTGGSNFATSTGINFVAASVLDGTGDFSSVPAPFTTGVTFSDFSFSSFPVDGVSPLWSFSVGGNSYSFDLKTLTIDTHDAHYLDLSGTGTLHMTGLDATNALWRFSTQSSDGGKVSLSFSTDNTAPVPIPGSLVLFASSIAGLASKRRFTRK